jgi:hypothetical protein
MTPELRLAHLAKSIFGRDVDAVDRRDGDLGQRDETVGGLHPRAAGVIDPRRLSFPSGGR